MDGQVWIIPSEERKKIKDDKEFKKEKHTLLKLWVIGCIVASFIAILILAMAITTYSKYFCF
jgi:hypothetical protein